MAMRGEIDHFFHLAAIYDITADAEAQQVANVEGTRHAIELAGAIEAGCFHQVSSIAAAGLYRGDWSEDMFDEAEKLDNNPYFRTKHESERLVREDCPRPWRVYRPGIVVGDSRTGAIDKIDGPYYFFKALQRARKVLPAWLPTIGIEGGEINIVPVDFVAAAIDHIAHQPDLDGRAFHLTDPNPRTAGEAGEPLRQGGRRAADALRLETDVTEPATTPCAPALRLLPAGEAGGRGGAQRARAARPVLTYVDYPTTLRLDRKPQEALAGSGHRRAAAGELRDAALGLLGAQPRPRPVQGPHPVRRGARQGRADHRRLVGIGRATAVKVADAGATVLLVARSIEKLEETKEEIVPAGGVAHIHRCDLADVEDVERMAEEVLTYHGHVDILVNNAGRSIRRSVALSYDRFHDYERTIQLNYLGALRLILSKT